MNAEEIAETGRASYSPEDNKLRLYVGRVPRPEYEALRAEGWTSTPKQDCDFVATWTPQRRDTALAYGAGFIEDEDQPAAERAADRAERFGGYRDKRLDEATGHADKYDAGPSAHGYQSQARAERSAARHDRIADRAGDQWRKAEYWQTRTAGVISHAPYKSRPDVRMGRIKTLEAELRKCRASQEEYRKLWADFKTLASLEGERQTQEALKYCGSRHVWANYLHPRAAELPEGEYYKTNETSLYSLLSHERYPITGAEAVALFFSNHSESEPENDWTEHLTLRLAYESQMLEAQGGRAAAVEMVPGGKLGGMLILKVNKSAVTGRVTSVSVLRPVKLQGWTYRGKNIANTEWSEHQIDTERLSPSAYQPPTEEDLAALEAVREKIKGAAPKKAACPLINPTDEDAERLQAIWNAHLREGYKPSTVERITQAQYSANSGGSYAACEAQALTGGGFPTSSHYMSNDKQEFPTVAKVRVHGRRVLILTDKPQKPFPASVWKDPRPLAVAECVKKREAIREIMSQHASYDWTAAQKELVKKAASVGLVSWASMSQFHITHKGVEAFAEADKVETVNA